MGWVRGLAVVPNQVPYFALNALDDGFDGRLSGRRVGNIVMWDGAAADHGRTQKNGKRKTPAPQHTPLPMIINVVRIANCAC